MQNEIIDTVDNAQSILKQLLSLSGKDGHEWEKAFVELELDGYLIHATINDLEIVKRKALLYTVIQDALKG